MNKQVVDPFSHSKFTAYTACSVYRKQHSPQMLTFKSHPVTVSRSTSLHCHVVRNRFSASAFPGQESGDHPLPIVLAEGDNAKLSELKTLSTDLR